jgi:hypothetical protein
MCSAENLVLLNFRPLFMPLLSPVGIRDADRPEQAFLPLYTCVPLLKPLERGSCFPDARGRSSSSPLDASETRNSGARIPPEKGAGGPKGRGAPC